MSSCKAAHFSDLSCLQQHEIAYLNICSWFYPQYLELTKYLETLDLAITYNGQKYPIKSWGLYHSLIGDLPFSGRKKISGGHCNYQNMLAATYEISETQSLAQGFKQVNLCHKKRLASSKPSTLFPNNWSPKRCVQEVIDAIKNPKTIDYKFKTNHTFEITSQNNYNFTICINKSGKATFYPANGFK